MKITNKTQPKIKHPDKVEPKIDSEKIAIALGAGEKTKLRQTPKGKKYLEVTTYEDGKKKIRKVFELTAKESDKYIYLGRSEGNDLQHCLYVAKKSQVNFWERSCGYYIDGPYLTNCKMSICFYGKK